MTGYNDFTQPVGHIGCAVFESYSSELGFTSPDSFHLLEAALAYARRGVPVFPIVAGKKVPYHGSRGHLDATTNLASIRESWRPGDNIGGRTGRISGLLVLDVDSMDALENLRREFHIPDTLTASTPSAGLHLYFRMPNVGITSRANVLVALIGPGLDVRADNGMVVLPPSRTPEGSYTVAEANALAEMPEALVEALIAECGKVSGGSSRSSKAIPYVEDGEPIPEGARNVTLTSCAGRLHDGTRSRDDLIEALLAVPCEKPPPPREVERIANSIFQREACRPGRLDRGDRGDGNAEVAEVLERAGAYWYDELLPGGGRSKARDTYRALMESGGAHGKIRTVTLDGTERRAVEFTDSYRQLAERAATSRESVRRNMDRLITSRAVIRSHERADTEGSTWWILEPATNRDTPTHPAQSRASEGVDRGCHTPSRPPVPPRPDRLETPYFRAGGWIGNARAGTLYALEAFGSQTDEELAGRVGFSRVRDYRRKHLQPLMDLGLVVEDGGRYGLATDHVQKAEEVRATRYSTERKRRVRRHDPTSGRIVTEVRENGTFLSEAERDEKAVRDHQAERERFKLHLARQDEAERDADNLLCGWYEKEGAAHAA